MGGETSDLPVVFSKFASAIIGPNENIVLPPISQQVDFEAELVVVIGKPGRFIAREQALEHVFGYTIGNDVSARDWQKGKPGGQWLLGKTFDTFAPIGPWIVTADDLDNPRKLDIELKLNGQIMQQGNTRDLIFPIDYLISHLSNFFTLQPGDLIFTGTPSGVGAGRQPPLFLQAGDSIEISISGIGTLKHGVEESSTASRPLNV
jgi:2-keto-4-pentenoate hydratase/2-oxohepta-3-ene-1,7-dioic acid hydratase in catechol pathway